MRNRKEYMNMDTVSSGSLQSSSGGEVEYDSRAADSIFETAHPPPHLGFISNPPPPRQTPLLLFDRFSNNSLLPNQNIHWPDTTSIRSDPNSHDTINPIVSTPSFQPPRPAAVGEDNRHVTVAPQNQTAARNPKKRSRASRRAPTTVLTTDTTNFRAMVQEFTGIPAQPFNNSSFSRSGLDLLGARSAAFGAAPPPPPLYLGRPFPQKVTSFSSNFLTPTAIAASSAANNLSSNLFNVQNPLLSHLLQPNPKFLFSNSTAMDSIHSHRSFEIPSNDIKIGGLDHVSAACSGLPNLVSPDHNDYSNNIAESWRKNGVGHDEDDDYQARAKRINGVYSFSRFHGEKGPENVAAKGEGMVESWICSSE